MIPTFILLAVTIVLLANASARAGTKPHREYNKKLRKQQQSNFSSSDEDY